MTQPNSNQRSNTATGPSLRRIVVFTSSPPLISTLEAIQAITARYPAWPMLVLEDTPRRLPRRVYVRRKVRRLWREPLSYPLELIVQLWQRQRKTTTEPTRPLTLDELCNPMIQNRVVNYRDGSAAEALRVFMPWLGISLGAPILPSELFDGPKIGTINIHKSLLPDYRGMPPGFWELYDGAPTSGVSIHWVNQGLDTGDLVDQVPCPIEPCTTPQSLSQQLDALTIPLLLGTLARLDADERPATPQAATRTPTRSRPPFLVRRALERRLRKRCRSLRDSTKDCVT